MKIVKICGITRPVDAIAAVRAGADWIGINFCPSSRRVVDIAAAAAIASAARFAGAVTVVGIFVNQDADFVDEAFETAKLDRVQLHGNETPAYCARFTGRYIKALAFRSSSDLSALRDYDCDTFLVDTPHRSFGGTGRTGDWSLARMAVEAGHRIMLAGGLNAENVQRAIMAVDPWGIDVATGVETTPGVKDAAKMAELVERVRSGGRR